MNTNRIKITFKNNFVRIVESDNVRNFSSLVEWMEMFNSGESLYLLTMSGRDLGSSFSIDKDNVKSIDFV
ncbi:hypothetical protein CHL78_016685 [Romboutsia weinsteinii]|uniref:Uncharacterized protein n=1 Tax=Romboutsia weinsteinii TaxID=2020949 RepID=A0A371IZ42_9FIRM|nr:hypothetical protein [Romboutsia weinsteinii]RDY25740.1 hypothetical protein CHL78_016685 [Romboutsia weinsteinii]